MLSNLKEGLKSLTLRAEATDGPNLFSKPCKKYALETLGNEGHITCAQSCTIFHSRLTLTTGASAPTTPLSRRPNGVTRDPLAARERATYTI